MKKLNSKIKNKKFISFIVKFWDKDLKSLSFFNKLFFAFLVLLEQFYRVFFFLIKIKKIYLSSHFRSRYKIVSVGNISCGGTGKSVFVSFIIKNLKHGAIVLRGYKSQNEKSGNSFLVADGENVYCDSKFCGDEALMLAKSLKVPVVIGKNRKKSVKILENNINLNLDYVVLDDAYQNYSLAKDIEILLLDARNYLKNGHCLPAGELREKDLSRATVIVFTHADEIKKEKLVLLQNSVEKKLNKNIFYGKHKPKWLLDGYGNVFDAHDFCNKKFVAFAGIGSFEGFLNSLKKLQINLFKSVRFEDHHDYVESDFQNILCEAEKLKVDGIITTSKDWTKLEPFINNLNCDIKSRIYFLEIEFDFLDENQKEKFFTVLKRKLFF